MPYADILEETIINVPDQLLLSEYATSTGIDVLAQVIFRKSSKVVTYHREFNKFDAYFSYVGGLVGTIIGMIFIMGPYTEKTYEISLAKKVLLDNESKEI